MPTTYLKRIGNIILPNFTEDDFISGIETHISHCEYPKYNVEISRISQKEEVELGYDGVLTSLIPFYIQFKTSQFLTPRFSGQIIEDRKNLHLNYDKGVFVFNLHIDKTSKCFDQHNSLFILANQNVKAAYVAPLFYKKENLSDLKFLKNKFGWTYRDIYIYELYQAYPFKNIPVFHNAITIPPHKHLNCGPSVHNYSFTKNFDVCFHSDAEIYENEGVATFHDFILEIVNSKNEFVDLETYSNKVFKLIPELFKIKWNSTLLKTLVLQLIEFRLGIVPRKSINIERLFGELTPYEKLVVFEYLLWDYFRIIQFFKMERII